MDPKTLLIIQTKWKYFNLVFSLFLYNFCNCKDVLLRTRRRAISNEENQKHNEFVKIMLGTRNT